MNYSKTIKELAILISIAIPVLVFFAVWGYQLNVVGV